MTKVMEATNKDYEGMALIYGFDTVAEFKAELELTVTVDEKGEKNYHVSKLPEETEKTPVCPVVKRLTDKMIDRAIAEKNVPLLIAYAIHAGHLAGQLFQSAKNGARVMESSRWCALTLKFDRAHEEAFNIDCKKAFREIYGQCNGAYPKENDQVYSLHISDFCCQD